MEVEEAKEEEVKTEMEEYIILEEDPEMYAMAGVELVSVPVPEHVNFASNIRQALATLPNASGSTFNFTFHGNVSNCTF